MPDTVIQILDDPAFFLLLSLIIPLMSDLDKWITQGKQVAEKGDDATEMYHFAVSMLAAVYGSSSPQYRAFMQAADQAYKQNLSQVFRHSRGAIVNTIRELELGLVKNLRTAIQGELLGDLVGLSREALRNGAEDAKNVAAVLAAAAYEDCLRRLAAEKAALQGRPKLDEVITTLRDAGLLQGGQLSQANSLLKFRNDSLHADWKQVVRSQVESCLALLDSLLARHFS